MQPKSDPTAIDTDQLGRDARGAFEFVNNSDYGKRYVSRLVEKHMGYHQMAEKDGLTPAQRSDLIVKAAGVKECLDMILNEANLIESGELERLEREEKLQEVITQVQG